MRGSDQEPGFHTAKVSKYKEKSVEKFPEKISTEVIVRNNTWPTRRAV